MDVGGLGPAQGASSGHLVRNVEANHCSWPTWGNVATMAKVDETTESSGFMVSSWRSGGLEFDPRPVVFVSGFLQVSRDLCRVGI